MSVSLLKKSPPAPDERLLSELRALAGRLDVQQLWWASGYLAGVAATAAPDSSGAAAEDAGAVPTWTVFYATETGNCRSLAEDFVAQARALGIEARAVDLATFRSAQLKQETHALFVVATHGLGDAPDGTEAFFEFIAGTRAPRLEGLSYAVLALGDSSYEDFCATGQALDLRLEALGARRLEARVDCDVDFENAAGAWQRSLLERAQTLQETAPGRTGSPHLVPVASRTHSRKEPFPAPVLENLPLTGPGSSKHVRHVVLSLEGSGLNYTPGDALGVWPTNPPQLVEQFLALFDLDGETEVRLDETAMSLRSALAHRLELTLLGRAFVEDYAARFDVAALIALLNGADRASSNAWLAERQIIDVLSEYYRPLSAQQLVDMLKRLTPRLYSIASSLAANPDEVHVTVGVVSYTAFGREHYGSASNFLAAPGDTVPVYIAPNPRFRLPADSDTPVIMIGAGTGVAPYRAFLEERACTGAGGDNWLLFGDRNFATDFLYQTEWARLRHDGMLTRHDVAFSRDQAAKVYVQDRIREQAAALFAWLERGAHVYVCGDAEHLAPAVHAALVEVVASGLGRDREAAEAYLREMKQHDRYQRDVY